MSEELNVLSDEELVLMAQEGSNTATNVLMNKYEKVVCAISKSYIKNVGNHYIIDEDILNQEGRMGLLNAINTYSTGKNALFKTYASTCISNKVINALKKQTKDSISFNILSLDNDEEEIDVASFDNVEEEVIFNSLFDDLMVKDNPILSDFERMVLREKIAGLSYKEIAEELDKDPKSIDNTIQRLKKKIFAYIRK